MNAFKLLVGIALVITAASAADQILFKDDFKGKLGDGWRWVRENRPSWRTTGQGLEVRIEPGNMWGPQNNAKNVLVRDVPDPAKTELEISVTVKNRPTEQYEQVDLVWYYDDSHQVKIGQELVDGKLSLVMGREEADRARTICIIPIDPGAVEVRFQVKGNQLRGDFRLVGAKEWRLAGECDLPVKGLPKIALQCYQGPANVERWAKITNFVIRTRDAAK